MSYLQHALALAEMGFYVFPCIQNSKRPVIDNFASRASRDKKTIESWWVDPVLGFERNYNIGIACSRFGRGDESLIAIDVDPKNGGDKTQLLLELEGQQLEGTTFSQKTPTGGKHYVFTTKRKLHQGTHVFGHGIDTRTAGGYILGAGSTIEGKPYLLTNRTGPVEAPDWIVEGASRVVEKIEVPQDFEVNEDYAFERASFYLHHEAPEAVEGQGGNQVTYRVACKLKDYGVNESIAKELMVNIYNQTKCVPKWDEDHIAKITENAYQYGKHSPGFLSPESQFQPVQEVKEDKLSPIKELNKEHAYILMKGNYQIIRETKDAEGIDIVEFWDEAAFHSYYLSRKMVVTVKDRNKEVQVTREWMNHPSRRTYDGLVFKPGLNVSPKWYNLWKGYSHKPSPKGTGLGHASVEAFCEHLKENICGGDPELTRWVTGHFAHLVQKPYEKPLTALVFKGKKGTGKSALLKFIGALIQPYFRVLANTNDMASNFNSHLENCLALVLEEAFWSGDKRSDAILKHLVTGDTHRIERKGIDAYYLPNLTRVYIIGNEEWLVPASEDERRYAVLTVKDTRRGDWKFFDDMRRGFEAGGYSHLLRYLMDFDIGGLNFTVAPMTEGLYHQKIVSLDAFGQWWFESLCDGELIGTGLGTWATSISRKQMHEGYLEFCNKRKNKRGFLESAAIFCARVADVADSKKNEYSYRSGEFELPTLQRAREIWDERMRYPKNWG